MQRRWVMAAAVAATSLLLAGVAVGAATQSARISQYEASALNRQNLGLIPGQTTPARTTWIALPGWGFSDGPLVQAKSGLAVTLSVTISGGPADFKVVLELGKRFVERTMNHPVRFDPGTGTNSFSYTFVAKVPPGGETVNLYWRSATGVPVTLSRGTVAIRYGSIA